MPLILYLHKSRVILVFAIAGVLYVPNESKSIFSRRISDGFSILRCYEVCYSVFVFIMNGLGGQ
jgi:hypothetical protein